MLDNNFIKPIHVKSQAFITIRITKNDMYHDLNQEKKVQKMHEDKKEAPSLIIPKSLLTFSKTNSYQQFLFAIYEYCKYFNETIKKYNDLK
jgi:hypothetical protein